VEHNIPKGVLTVVCDIPIILTMNEIYQKNLEMPVDIRKCRDK